MLGDSDIRRSVRLDAKTDKLLVRLATRHESNISLTIRELVRDEAKRAGFVAAPDKTSWFDREGGTQR